MDLIKINEDLLRRIVRSVDKAVSDDIPEYLREHYKETNNAVPHLRGDFINDNLRNFVVNENIKLFSFNRSSWQGRIIVDSEDKITYTITTKKTLKEIQKKQRSKPHYHQTLLFKLNGEFEGIKKQLSFIDVSPFEEDELEQDFIRIFNNNKLEDYVHYIVTYEAIQSELIDIQLEFLDKDFDPIEVVSLNEYIKPDFSRITDIEFVSGDFDEENEVKALVGLKPGLRPKLKRDQNKPNEI